MDFLNVLKIIVEIISPIIVVFIIIRVVFFRKYHIVIRNYKGNAQLLKNIEKLLLPELEYNNEQNISKIAIWYKVKQGIKELNKVINKNNYIYIVGDGGSGKSTLLRYVYKYCYKYCFFVMPLYIQFKDLKDVDQPIYNAISDHIEIKLKGNIEINNNESKWKLLSNLFTKPFQLYIFLDGYDEIVLSKNSFEKIDNEIKEISRCNSNIKIIISSRYEPHLYDNDLHFKKIEIKNLTEEQKKHYLGKEYVHFENIKDKINNPLLMTMYSMTCNLVHDDNDYVKNIKISTDIFWNYYCYQWKKTLNQQNGVENANVVFIKYILPFVAYNLEFENKDDFNTQELLEYINKFSKNFYSFKEYFGFDCEVTDVEKLVKSNIFKNDYIYETNIINCVDNTSYKFSHLLQKNFYAALYEYYKDCLILGTNYNKKQSNNHYIPYEKLDEKVTIHNSTRFFYSNIIARYIKNKNGDSFQNKVKYYCIMSDLHYYGDSELVEENIEDAKYESLNGYIEYTKGNGDKLSGNWISWNLAFIVFQELKSNDVTHIYNENEKRYVESAIEALNVAMINGYIPAFDKMAYVYHTGLWKILLNNGIKMIDDTPKNNEDALNKAKKLLNKAKEGEYHFAFNNYGYLLEKENDINGAFFNFKKSVEYDPLDFYSRSRCALYLLHNYYNIDEYKHYPFAKKIAYEQAKKYLSEGYKYFKKIEFKKPYEIKAIFNMLSNLAEYDLIVYYCKPCEILNYDLNSSFEYYKALFSIINNEFSEKKMDKKSILKNDNYMREILCYCLVTLILKNENQEIEKTDVFDISFKELCLEVKKYFYNYTFKNHAIFHLERFNKYYDEFLRLFEGK